MSTSDAELRFVGPQRMAKSDAREWLADRAAVKALVEALPRCCGRVVGDELEECSELATHEGWDGDYRCDKHQEGASRHGVHPWAPALRALLERIRGWDGEP